MRELSKEEIEAMTAKPDTQAKASSKDANVKKDTKSKK